VILSVGGSESFSDSPRGGGGGGGEGSILSSVNLPPLPPHTSPSMNMLHPMGTTMAPSTSSGPNATKLSLSSITFRDVCRGIIKVRRRWMRKQ
jgi:hypothetical protein